LAAATAEHQDHVPSLRDGDLRWVLLVAPAMQVLSWSLLEGRQLADSVEYKSPPDKRRIDAGGRVLVRDFASPCPYPEAPAD